MNTNIDLSGLDNHFFSENSKDSINNNNNIASIKTKITKYNFYSVNEAQISDKIRILPNYNKKFNIIEDYEFVNISQLNEERIEKLNLNNNSNKDNCQICKIKLINTYTIENLNRHR